MAAVVGQLQLNFGRTDQGVYHNGEAECLTLSLLAQQHADEVTTSHSLLPLSLLIPDL